ncbi:MAG TPA: uroporphyrinogen-III synthase, partial [Lysobacter sp.]
MHDSLSTGPRWYVISLRPRGQHQPLRDVARRAGHAAIALSPLRIRMHHDEASRAALAAALACDLVVFTSPNAVAAARSMTALPPGLRTVAIGEGTRRALRRAGIAEVHAPARMDSEGVLDLPVLANVAGLRIGLVSAPGGRNRIAPALHARGARVQRADIYTREPCGLPRAGLRAMRGAAGRLALALSSGEAL